MRTLILGLMPRGISPNSVIAAGPWCFCGQEEDFSDWEESFTFAPEPLANPEIAAVAVRACQTLCVRLVGEVASLLEPEQEKLTPAYWQILLTPWLMDLTSQVIERALRCQAMREVYGHEPLSVPVLPLECVFNFEDEQDFTLRGILGVAYNHWLFSRLLEADWPDTWQKIELPPTVTEKAAMKRGLIARLKDIGRGWSQQLNFPRLKGMKAASALKLSDALNHVCVGPDHSLNLEETFNFNKDLAKIPILAPLEPIIRASLPASIKKLRHKPCAPDKCAPRLRVAAPNSFENALYRQQLALWRASGNRIAHVQHGGNYGEVKTPCTAAVCEYSQDAFFTWGWQTQGCAPGNFIPLPSLQLSREGKWRQGEDLIFVGTEMTVYGRRLDSHPTPLQYLAYRRAKAEFFENLGPNLQAQSVYRPYFPLPGTFADASWLLPRFPALRVCAGELLPRILHCRLLIVDHPGTTLLEALAAGIPVIAYWNRRFWPFAPECDNLLDMLEAAGIWQPSARAAAIKAREVWVDPDGWRHSREVKLAALVFCKRQAYADSDAINIWIKALKDL